jgi:hypothetical protein
MRPLVGESITFHTCGENKNARTAVHVFILARSNTSATPDQHSDFVSWLLPNGALRRRAGHSPAASKKPQAIP